MALKDYSANEAVRSRGQDLVSTETKPETNGQTLGFSGKTRMEYVQNQDTRDKQIKNENEATVE